MPVAFLLACAACAGPTILTYLYLRDASFRTRLCVGLCTGLAAEGLTGFVLASWLGIQPATLVLIPLLSLPLLLVRSTEFRARVLEDINHDLHLLRHAVAQPNWQQTGPLVFYAGVATVLWQLCDRAMFESVQGIFTGLDTNLGDLPFHLSIITSLAHGENFPPQHPEFAGVPITYPFIVDFVTALSISAGASLRQAFVWQNFAMMLALFGLIHHWAQKLTGDRLAAPFTPVLVFLSGGLGWWMFLKESAQNQGVMTQLGQLAHDYSIGLPGYRWGNALTALFVPQRGILLGVGLAVIVWVLWLQSWKEFEDQKHPYVMPSLSLNYLVSLLTASPARSMIAAGIVAGLLPLVHAHSFVVTMLMGGCLAFLQGISLYVSRQDKSEVNQDSKLAIVERWLPFFTFAALVGGPQMLWATHGSAVQSGNFIGWQFGWDHGVENVFWFWFKNTAFFIPLLVLALVWHKYENFISRRVLYFCLPFTICFILPNSLRLAPWVWDNIKVLFYWWLALAPIVALVLAKMWRKGGAVRAVAVSLIVMQLSAGGLDVWRAVYGTVERQTFGPSAIQFAELVRKSTAPQAVILHAPTYNDPVYLTGRRTFVGYPGHLWSHGLEFSGRVADLNHIYTGSPNAADLLVKNRIDYVVVGPLEEAELRNAGLNLNRAFFERYPKVGEVGEYRLYKTAQP